MIRQTIRLGNLSNHSFQFFDYHFVSKNPNSKRAFRKEFFFFEKGRYTKKVEVIRTRVVKMAYLGYAKKFEIFNQIIPNFDIFERSKFSHFLFFEIFNTNNFLIF